MRNLRAMFVVLVSILCCSNFWAQASDSQSPRVIHVVVALADNQYQGIVPVPAALGNGDDPNRNLYWGAGGGVRTFFQGSPSWRLLGKCTARQYPQVERCIFRHSSSGAILVADAYRGREIKSAISDFFAYSAGHLPQEIGVEKTVIRAGGESDLIAYVGHDGLMVFSLGRIESPKRGKPRKAIILACASKQYFADALRQTGSEPLLWTTNLMAPEAYTLEAALNAWLANETDEVVRERAAVAYDKYQHCGLKAARRLFATGW